MIAPLGRILGLVVTISALASPARAQDDPRFALRVAFPTPTVSLEWSISERIALRLDGSYTYRHETNTRLTGSHTDFTTGVTVTEETTTELAAHNSTIGVGALLTIKRNDALHLYVAPRAFLSMSSYRATESRQMPAFPAGGIVVSFDFPDSPNSQPRTLEEATTSPGVGFLFGASSDVHRRLALFGEAGVTYVYDDASSPSNSLLLFDNRESRRRSVNTYALAGVKFRF
jgi:hypothetical protein